MTEQQINLHSKKDYQNLLLTILKPLIPHYSTGCARLHLDGGGATYPEITVEFEAFARPLWGLVPFWIGGGRDREFEDIYQKGISNGADPDSPEFWGHTGEMDQRFVEMAPLAFGLIAVPEILWNPLSEKTKDNLSSWLYEINEHELPKCNWYFFRILVNAALKKLGRPYSASLLESDMSFIESNYIADGWYKDGVSGRFDYYSAFAMQFYSILYSVFAEERDGIYERAEEFSSSFIKYFSEKGAAIPYGRSLIYRFAESAFWSAYLFIDGSIDDGTVKGIINRNIRYFLSKDIMTHDGILTVGYCYPNLTMAEKYNAPGSPYWSLKTFLMLALPDDDPFWSADEKPLTLADGSCKLSVPSFLIDRKHGEAYLYTPGMLNMRSLGHFTDKYDKFVYSTLFPFSVARTNEMISENAPDNMLAFLIDGYVYVRRGSIEFSIEDDSITSLWEVPGVRIRTEIKLTERGHIRHHTIDSTICCKAYDCGFSIPRLADYSAVIGDDELSLSSSGLISAVKGKGTLEAVIADPNSSLAWRNSAFPAAVYDIPVGQIEITDEFYGYEE